MLRVVSLRGLRTRACHDSVPRWRSLPWAFRLSRFRQASQQARGARRWRPPSRSRRPRPPRQCEPSFKYGQIVSFDTPYKRGTVLVVSQTPSLYYVLGNGRAVKYRVATAKNGFEWDGTHKVSQKVEWPDWRPPEQMRQRRPELPAFMAGGPDNPLGARAIYLGSSLYRIHGTNEPSSIGRPASSGCIRMLNQAVTELYCPCESGRYRNRHVRSPAIPLTLA